MYLNLYYSIKQTHFSGVISYVCVGKGWIGMIENIYLHTVYTLTYCIKYKSLKTLRIGDDILYPNKRPFHDKGFVHWYNILYYYIP